MRWIVIGERVLFAFLCFSLFTIFFDLSQKLVHHDVESSQESKQESVLRTGSLRADPQKETEFSFLSFDWKKRADEATERTLGSYGSYGS